jgi:hypothetical protein
VSFDLGFYTEQCRHNDQTGTGEIECEPCTFDTESPTTPAITVLNTDASAFPDLSTFVRVDTPAGNAGDLDSDDFTLCEGACSQDVTATFNPGERQADIVFVFDDSGSMGGEIGTLQSRITSFVDDVEAEGIDARYALVSFRDTVATRLDFTDDPGTIQTAVNGLSAGGGGDFPEDNLDAIGVATRNLSPDSGPALSPYRPSAQRIVIDITDAAGHVDEEGFDAPHTDLTAVDVQGFLTGYTYYAVSSDFTIGQGQITKRELADLVGGTWTDIGSADFSLILDDLVGEITAPTYRLDYTTPTTTTDGDPRTVELQVSDPSGTLYGEGTYTP